MASPDEIDSFVKNAHHIKLLRGRRYGVFDESKEELGTSKFFLPSEAQDHSIACIDLQ